MEPQFVDLFSFLFLLGGTSDPSSKTTKRTLPTTRRLQPRAASRKEGFFESTNHVAVAPLAGAHDGISLANPTATSCLLAAHILPKKS